MNTDTNFVPKTLSCSPQSLEVFVGFSQISIGENELLIDTIKVFLKEKNPQLMNDAIVTTPEASLVCCTLMAGLMLMSLTPSQPSDKHKSTLQTRGDTPIVHRE